MILLPTRGRPDNLRRYIYHYFMMGGTEPHVVIYEKSDYRQYKSVLLPEGWIKRKFRGGKGACTHFNDIFAEFPGLEYYGIAADDVVPETFEWDKKLKAACLPDKVAVSNDGMNHKEVAGNRHGVEHFPTHPFIGGDLVRKWGFIVPPCLTHHGADDWWFEAGNQVVCADIMVRHHHHLNGLAEMDDTYRNRPRGHNEKLKYKYFKDMNQHLIFKDSYE